MILRRITDNLRRQNWTVLMSELLVLVVGIFLGFQLEGWNEDRKNRVVEAHYLERLHSDTELNLQDLELRAKTHLERAASLQGIAKKLERGTIEGISAVDAEMSFCYWYVTEDVRTRTAAYDELVATGNIDLIRNGGLREQILLVHAEYDRSRNDIHVVGSVLPGIASVMQPHIKWHESAVRTEVNDLIIEANCSADLAAMAEDRDVISALWQLYRGQMIVGTLRRDQIRILERLIEAFENQGAT